MLIRACRCRPPGSPFEVIEAKFLLELLMGLLAEPARLDGGGEDFQRRLGQVREVVLVLACRTALAHEPDLFVAWEVLVRPFSGAGRGAVGDADPHRGEGGPERALGAAPPCDGPPSLKAEHLRAATGLMSGTGLWRGRPRGATGQVSPTSSE